MIQFILPALGLGASLAGMSMQNRAAGIQAEAVNRAKQAEWDRQKRDEDRLSVLSQDGIDRLTELPGDVDDSRARLHEMFRRAAMAGQDEEQYSDTSSAGSQDAALRKAAVAQSLGARSSSMGDLGAMGSAMGDLALETARRNSDMDGILSARRRSASILPFELEAAMQQGQDKAAMGKILGALGQTAMSAGMSGALGGGGGAGGMGAAGAVGTEQSNGAALISSLFSRFGGGRGGGPINQSGMRYI